MTLPLNPEMLGHCYDFLRATPPFRSWNLPEVEDMAFRVIRAPLLRGWYECIRGRHTIAVSTRTVGFTENLVATMAHEMVHLHQALTGMDRTGAQHNAAFHQLARQVCRAHGFDPKIF